MPDRFSRSDDRKPSEESRPQEPPKFGTTEEGSWNYGAFGHGSGVAGYRWASYFRGGDSEKNDDENKRER